MAQWIRRLTSNQKIVGSSPIVVDLLFFFASPFFSTCTEYVQSTPQSRIQSTSRITTLGGASEKCPYSRSVVIPEVPYMYYMIQLDGTLLRTWKFCRYSRIVVISAVVI